MLHTLEMYGLQGERCKKGISEEQLSLQSEFKQVCLATYSACAIIYNVCVHKVHCMLVP